MVLGAQQKPESSGYGLDTQDTGDCISVESVENSRENGEEYKNGNYINNVMNTKNILLIFYFLVQVWIKF